jgi:hypothetical protein
MNVDGQETQNAAPVDGATAQAPAPEAAAELNINDLNAMKVIIDIASSRGAFKPNEMTAVGQTYTKLTNFLDQVAKQSEGAKQ